MELPALGIDVSKNKLDVALVLNGKTLCKVVLNSSKGYEELISWLERKNAGKVHACLEATGTYGEGVATALAEGGHVVSMVNPTRIKGFCQSALARTKTDKKDAQLIAQFCLAWRPEAWVPPAPEVKKLQEMVRHRENLEEMYQMEDNRSQAGLRSPEVLRLIEENKAHLLDQLKELQCLIDEHIDQNPKLKGQQDLLTSIKGVGEKTANAILGEIGDISNYQSARELAAYAGLTPSEHSSGSSVRRKAHLSKKGNAHLRKALYFPAITAKNFNPIVKAFCKNLEARKKPKMAIIGAAMRKLLHIAYGVLKHQRPFEPRYAN